MTRSVEQLKAQAAWDHIEALGGCGVWDGSMVVVSLANTAITNDDLALFHDFPYVEILNVSDTSISDAGLRHLAGLQALKDLIVINTKIGDAALEAFRRAHPSVRVTTEPPPKGTINPFTGKPL